MKPIIAAHFHTLICAFAFVAALGAYVAIALVAGSVDAAPLKDVVYLLGGATAGTAGTQLVK